MEYMFTESYLARGFLCESGEVFAEYNRDMVSLQMRLLDSLSDDLFMEGSDDKPEGIVASAFRAIGRLIQGVIDQIRKIFGGARLRKGCENEKLQLSRDPNMLTKYLNGYYKDSRDALKRAASGKMSVDEADSFIKKSVGGFESIKPTIMSAASAFGLVGIHEKLLKKWKSEAESVMREIEVENGKTFSAVTGNMADKDNKKEATKNSVSIILGSLRSMNHKGLDALLEIPKLLYQKNYLTNKINAEAEESRTIAGRKKNASRLRRAKRDNDKMAKSIDREGKNRNSYQADNIKGKTKVRESEKGVKDAMARNYADMRESASSDFGRFVQGGLDALRYISKDTIIVG